MKKKIHPPVYLENFFKILQPNEVPGLVSFYKQSSAYDFYRELSKKENTHYVENVVDVSTMFFYMFLLGSLCYFYSAKPLVFLVCMLVSGVAWIVLRRLITQFYRMKIECMAKEIATHISEESFMVIHSQFLLKHLTKLGNECGGRGDFFEVASFGVRLAEIPTEVFKNNKLGYYKVPESYWMVVAKCLNEFGATDNSFYEKFLIMAQKSMVKNGRIYSPLILRSAQELVDAWRKHQEVLISYDQKYYLFTLFISMERVVRHCLEEKR